MDDVDAGFDTWENKDKKSYRLWMFDLINSHRISAHCVDWF